MRVGNTPTCVGKTRPAFVVTVRNWKHPHMRGEDRTVLNVRALSNRNTPTCVGKTHDAHGIGSSNQKHPHMRGEDANAANSARTRTRTRPKHPHMRGEDSCFRQSLAPS